MPSLGLASVICVESLNTSPMNALKRSKSICQITKMTKRKNSRMRNQMILTLQLVLFKDFYATRKPPTPHSNIKFFLLKVCDQEKSMQSHH